MRPDDGDSDDIGTDLWEAFWEKIPPIGAGSGGPGGADDGGDKNGAPMNQTVDGPSKIPPIGGSGGPGGADDGGDKNGVPGNETGDGTVKNTPASPFNVAPKCLYFP